MTSINNHWTTCSWLWTGTYRMWRSNLVKCHYDPDMKLENGSIERVEPTWRGHLKEGEMSEDLRNMETNCQQDRTDMEWRRLEKYNSKQYTDSDVRPLFAPYAAHGTFRSSMATFIQNSDWQINGYIIDTLVLLKPLESFSRNWCECFRHAALTAIL